MFAAALLLSGCGGPRGGDLFVAQWKDECGECHADMLEKQAAGPHAPLGCDGCHEGVLDGGHLEEPEAVPASIDWTIDGCAPCHEGEAETYLYDDNLRVGPFGGSQREPGVPKRDTFPQYDQVVAGHPFSKDYNEEGAHAYMLLDHYETTRGKFETCVQCKSTKVAYAWNSERPILTSEDVEVTLKHTKTETQTAQVVTIPAGTKVTWSSTDDDHQTQARAEFPDGTVYSSYDGTGSAEAPTKDFNMTWAATIAAISETMPYGAGCNHCHDPHSTDERIIRVAMQRAIARSGVNPYLEGSPKSFEEARLVDKQTVVCAQCHVEYVCGKSSVDGIDRDYFSWAKAADLHEVYETAFGYQQDWAHKTIGQPLIKSQHPETELTWNSRHYQAQVSCADCHMPRVRTGGGKSFRSHWFTSPYKYGNAEVFASFANATGLQPGFVPRPCANCHVDRTSIGIGQQETVFARQAVVQEGLVESAALLGEIAALMESGKTVDKATYDSAVESHRRAHVLWENLIVSENSMGFHNFKEVMGAMADAEKLVGEAIAAEKKVLGR